MIQLSAINTASDTFQNWVDKTNSVINTIANSVMTANGYANGATTTGNAYLVGILAATTFAANSLGGGNVQSAANLTITTNAFFTGSLLTLGGATNLVFTNTSMTIGANMVVNTSTLFIGNSSVNAIANSTVIRLLPNLQLTGTTLSLGNSTANVSMNTSSITLSGQSVIVTNIRDSVAVNGTLVGSAGRINFSGSGSASVAATVDVGNNQVNVVVTATATAAGAGANTNVIYNAAGSLGGNNGFTYDPTVNNVFIANTLTVSTVNVATLFQGNSTINTVSNSTAQQFVNSSITTSYNISGWSVGANVVANASVITVGSTVANSSAVATPNVAFTTQITGGSITINTTAMAVGSAVQNSSAFSIGTATVNASSLALGANLVVNTSFIQLGNTTVSFTSNSSSLQVANASVATIANSFGLSVGSNVSVSYQAVTVGATTVNAAAISAASYVGSGIATTTQLWNNAAGKVLTTDQYNTAHNWTALTDGTSISLDMSTGINFSFTLAGNHTLVNPTNVVVGRVGFILVRQNASGGHGLSFDTNYHFGTDYAPSIGQSALGYNLFQYVCMTSSYIIINIVNENKDIF